MANTFRDLEIIIVTYNRARYVRRTLEMLLAEKSPVKDCTITVQDNNSNDDTHAVVEEISSRYPNLRFRRNKYNLGIAGNIFRAMESADKDYVWILGDDDAYDFSGWGEVSSAMERGEKVICLSRYNLPDVVKNDVAAQLMQITFVTGCVYSKSLFTDDSIRDSIYNVFNLFPHLMPIVHHINAGGTIYVTNAAIADNGLLLGDNKDCSYNRGIKKVELLSPRVRKMNWMVGWASVCQAIADPILRKRTLLYAIKRMHGTALRFIGDMFFDYHDGETDMLLAELYAVLPFSYRVAMKLIFIPPVRIVLSGVLTLMKHSSFIVNAMHR